MSDLSVPHLIIPHGPDHYQFQDYSLVQTKVESVEILCDVPYQQSPSEQINAGEENINFAGYESKQEGQEKCTESDFDFSHRLPHKPDDHSSNSGSTVSEDMSFSDSEDSVEVPEFNPAESKTFSAPVNEVVSGVSHPFIRQVESSCENIAIRPSHLEQQQVPTLFSDNSKPLVTPDKWPPTSLPPANHQQNPTQDDCTSAVQPLFTEKDNPANDILRMDSLPLPQESDSRRGNLVVGISRSRTNSESSLVSPDIIKEPNDFLQKSVGVLGKSLNPIVSFLHNDPSSEVKFRVRKKTGKQKTQSGSYTYEMRAIPASDLSDSYAWPEAFDGRSLLQHIRRYAPNYGSFLDMRGSSRDLKHSIDLILGMIPRRLNHSLTTAALTHTLFHMEGLLESFVDGLMSANKPALAAHVKEGMNELNSIRNTANCARRLSLELTKYTLI